MGRLRSETFVDSVLEATSPTINVLAGLAPSEAEVVGGGLSPASLPASGVSLAVSEVPWRRHRPDSCLYLFPPGILPVGLCVQNNPS